MARSKHITVRIEGSSFYGHDLLPDVVRQMNAMVRLLTDLADDPKKTKVEVISLTKHSPLVAEVRVVHVTERPAVDRRSAPPKPSIRAVNKPVDRLTKAFDTATLERPQPKKVDTEGLLALEDFAKMLREDVAYVSVDGVERKIDDRLLGQIERRLGLLVKSRGSVMGVLESLNIHAKNPWFDIYPTIGPRKIRCNFRREMLPDVTHCVGSMVRVTGMKEFQAGAMWPIRISTDEIKAVEPAKPGTWSTLIGDLGALWESATPGDLEFFLENAA